MHVAKTAGQSLNAAMMGHHRGRTAGLTEPAALHRFLDLTPHERDARFDLVRGHLVTWGFHKHFSRDAVYVSAMREPIARICSLFNYIHTRPQHGRHTLFKRKYPSLDAFTDKDFALDWVREYFSNAYIKFYTGAECVPDDPGAEIARLRQEIAAGRFLCGPLEVVARRLAAMGRLEYPIPQENRTVLATDPDFVPADPSRLSAAADARLRAWNAVDLTLYDALSKTWAGA